MPTQGLITDTSKGVVASVAWPEVALVNDAGGPNRRLWRAPGIERAERQVYASIPSLLCGRAHVEKGSRVQFVYCELQSEQTCG